MSAVAGDPAATVNSVGAKTPADWLVLEIVLERKLLAHHAKRLDDLLARAEELLRKERAA